jgi:hypothetical protein
MRPEAPARGRARSGPAQRRPDAHSVDRRSRNLFLVALVVVIGLTGAAVFLLGGNATGDSDGPPGTEAAVGVIVGVESGGLDKVRGFDLRTTDQGTLAFELGTLDNGAVFPPGHLVEHQATAQPVRVWYRTEDGVRVAVRLEDAT